MQPYKGYFIDGNALPVHPFSPDWYVGGSVLVSGHHGSLVGITRFQLQRFTVSMKELANGLGLRLRAWLWTNAWLRDRTEWPNTSNAPAPSVTAIWESCFPNGRCPVQAINGGA
jgi:hypothetical protein